MLQKTNYRQRKALEHLDSDSERMLLEEDTEVTKKETKKWKKVIRHEQKARKSYKNAHRNLFEMRKNEIYTENIERAKGFVYS